MRKMLGFFLRSDNMGFMKAIISVICAIIVLSLFNTGCASSEKSRLRNPSRQAEISRPDGKGQLAPVAEAPHANGSWGGNLGPY